MVKHDVKIDTNNSPFYPAKTKSGDFLTLYAERYLVVEVDSTFYRIPSSKMVEDWRDRTPAHFRFSLKVPQVITHEKVLKNTRANVSAFLAAASKLGDKLRCCVLQFAYFNKDAFSGLGEFLERLEPFLDDWPKEYPLAVEIRNKNWLTEKFTDALRKRKAALVLIDQAWMPPIKDVMAKIDSVTGPFGYVRLLGDRKPVDDLTDTLDKTVIDRDDQIRADAEAIRKLAERVEVLAFVNNHFAGFAPATIELLRKALET